MQPIRNHILARFPTDDTVFTDEWVTETTGEQFETSHGAEVVYADGIGWIAAQPTMLGELVTCVWCVSFWIALAATVVLWSVQPGLLDHPVWWLMLPFALSMFTGLAHRE